MNINEIMNQFGSDHWSNIQGLIGILITGIVTTLAFLRGTRAAGKLMAKIPHMLQLFVGMSNTVAWFRYTEECERNGEKPLSFSEWKSAGRPTNYEGTK